MLDQLIDKLSTESASLVEILLKTKILLVSIDQPELVKWVNSELGGYGPLEQLPEYRHLDACLRGAIRSPVAASENHQLPTRHLGEGRRKVEVVELRVSIGMVQDLVSREKADEGGIQFPIPLEANGLISKGLAEGWVLTRAWSEVQPSQMVDVLTQVRSRLLDFLLALRKTAGNNASTETIVEKTLGMDVSGAFQGAVFGNNVTVTIGSANRVTVQNKHVSTTETLYRELAAAGVSENDLKELASAIDEDKHDGGVPSLTRATGRWYERLLAKAKTGALSISADVVSQTVAGLILAFISSGAG